MLSVISTDVSTPAELAKIKVPKTNAITGFLFMLTPKKAFFTIS